MLFMQQPQLMRLLQQLQLMRQATVAHQDVVTLAQTSIPRMFPNIQDNEKIMNGNQSGMVMLTFVANLLLPGIRLIASMRWEAFG